MIALLNGTVERREPGAVIVLCGGVGYRVFVPDAGAFAPGAVITLHTHEAVRADSHELFGFLERERLELFERLIMVSGIGPRSGQKIVASASADRVKAAVLAGDVAFLSSIPGVGKKTAQKIILELKGVLAEEQAAGSPEDEALQALVGLGYARAQAAAALEGLPAADVEARLRAALKRLSR